MIKNEYSKPSIIQHVIIAPVTFCSLSDEDDIEDSEGENEDVIIDGVSQRRGGWGVLWPDR